MLARQQLTILMQPRIRRLLIFCGTREESHCHWSKRPQLCQVLLHGRKEKPPIESKHNPADHVCMIVPRQYATPTSKKKWMAVDHVEMPRMISLNKRNLSQQTGLACV